jgi:hypothetical protein
MYSSIEGVVAPNYNIINTEGSTQEEKKFLPKVTQELEELFKIIFSNNNMGLPSNLNLYHVVDAISKSTLPMLQCPEIKHTPFNKIVDESGKRLNEILLSDETIGGNLDLFFEEKENTKHKLCTLYEIVKPLIATLELAIEEGNVDFVRKSQFSENLGITSDKKILVLDYLNKDQQELQFSDSIKNMEKMVDKLKLIAKQPELKLEREKKLKKLNAKLSVFCFEEDDTHYINRNKTSEVEKLIHDYNINIKDVIIYNTWPKRNTINMEKLNKSLLEHFTSLQKGENDAVNIEVKRKFDKFFEPTTSAEKFLIKNSNLKNVVYFDDNYVIHEAGCFTKNLI